MSAQPVVGTVIGALIKHMQIEIGDLEREPIGVLDLPHAVVEVGDAQAVGERATVGEDVFEQPILVESPHAIRRAIGHDIDGGGEGLQRANHQVATLRTGGVRTQQVKRLTVQSVYDRLD
jgi:hypothetical protein